MGLRHDAICIYKFIYVFVCVYLHGTKVPSCKVDMHTHTHTHTHTHIHTQTPLYLCINKKGSMKIQILSVSMPYCENLQTAISMKAKVVLTLNFYTTECYHSINNIINQPLTLGILLKILHQLRKKMKLQWPLTMFNQSVSRYVQATGLGPCNMSYK